MICLLSDTTGETSTIYRSIVRIFVHLAG